MKTNNKKVIIVFDKQTHDDHLINLNSILPNQTKQFLFTLFKTT